MVCSEGKRRGLLRLNASRGESYVSIGFHRLYRPAPVLFATIRDNIPTVRPIHSLGVMCGRVLPAYLIMSSILSKLYRYFVWRMSQSTVSHNNASSAPFTFNRSGLQQEAGGAILPTGREIQPLVIWSLVP